MKTYIRKALALGLTGLTAATLPGCEKFLEVENPNSLETDAIDPERDARLLSQSVFQNFISGTSESGLEDMFVYAAWFTNHVRVGDTFPTRNDVGRRDIPSTNAHTTSFWNYLHKSMQFARATIKSTEAAGNTVDLARARFVSASAIMLLAEYFCEGTIADNTGDTPVSRGRMSTIAMLDSAIIDYQKVQAIVAAITPATTELTNLSTASQVGIARAHLQAGRAALASAAAATVPAAFNYTLTHVDNSTQRLLGNKIWYWSESRISLVVGPEFRAMADAGDTRIAYVNANRLAQDGELQFYRQNKITGWGNSFRFASGLEATYVKLEADKDLVAMLAFINTRRAVGAQGVYTGATTLDGLMTELILQKSKDFWLEGKNLADFRRVPQYYPFVLPTTATGAASTYYKPALGPVKTDTCWPVPQSEIINNKEWK